MFNPSIEDWQGDLAKGYFASGFYGSGVFLSPRNTKSENFKVLIIVGRKSPYFSEGLDSPSLRQ